MFSIKNIRVRKILNSHVQYTSEFILELEDGSVGIGASSQGETISIYEDKKVSIDPENILKTLEADHIVGVPIDQVTFDAYLQQHRREFGQNNAYGLSEAFFNATQSKHSLFELFQKPRSKLTRPFLCLNILNGGWHAYTNPVLSDFSEFMLVSKSDDYEEVIAEHNEIQKVVRQKQLAQAKVAVSGNPVNCFRTRDNREVLEFLLDILNSLGLSDKYDLMIDASAGDLWKGNGYCLGVTDESVHSPDQFVKYWLDLIEKYSIRFLEDPFHEKDFDSWRQLTAASDQTCIIGDNLYSSSADRILEGAANKYTHAAVVKPNQAGTITAVKEAIDAAQRSGQVVISSHRSISTESTFLSKLTCILGVRYIKIGPLPSDYSSIVRLNEIIRLTEDNHGS